MSTIQVFDKPMCCSSGVCGTDVDPALVAFSADLQWLDQQGVHVERINPAHQPSLYAANDLVRESLKTLGNECLPLIVVNNKVVSHGIYPSRSQLAGWTGAILTSVPELPVLPTSCCGSASDQSDPSTCCS